MHDNRMAWLILLISGMTLVHSQDYRQLNILNPDVIYVEEAGQRYPFNVSPITPLGRRIQSLLNPQAKETLRLPANLMPDDDQRSNVANVIPLSRPSVDLQPPHHSSNGNGQREELPQTSDRFADVSDGQVNLPKAPTMKPAVNTVSRGLSQFGINMMKVFQSQPGNVVLSPYSVGTVLALLQQGSLGTTQQQITNALQISPAEAAEGFKGLTEDLQKRDSVNTFKSGNGIFVDDTFSISPAYRLAAMFNFNSIITPVKFSRPQKAAGTINDWVSDATNHKIEKLINPDSISSDTQLVLVNAVYFKGIWNTKFKPEATLPMDFNLPNGNTKSTPFMRMRRYLNAGYDRSISSQVVVLPFKGNQFSLVVILPDQKASVTSALSALTFDNLVAYQNISLIETELALPKFTVKFDSSLVSVFQQLGIYNMFNSNSDFSGIGNSNRASPYVSSAVHSALLSIDEEGGIGSAATAFAAVALSYSEPSMSIIVNRPFIAVLWDAQTSVPLFMAKIEEPIL